jgi:hypothetical protein
MLLVVSSTSAESGGIAQCGPGSGPAIYLGSDLVNCLIPYPHQYIASGYCTIEARMNPRQQPPTWRGGYHGNYRATMVRISAGRWIYADRRRGLHGSARSNGHGRWDVYLTGKRIGRVEGPDGAAGALILLVGYRNGRWHCLP